jgi:hypothetical protein
MKSTTLKQALSLCLSISATFFVASNAHANFEDSYLYLHDGIYDDTLPSAWKGYDTESQAKEALKAISDAAEGIKKTVGYAAYLNNCIFGLCKPYFNSGNGKWFFNTISLSLPGYQKRDYVFKLQKSANGVWNGPRTDLVFDSYKDADQFCKDLTTIAGTLYGRKSGSQIGVRHGFIKRSIAVAYWIAYDTGSQEEKDTTGKGTGTSTRAQKNVICTNPWDWIPNPRWADENELTGIQKSDLRNTEDGHRYYDVACMDKKGYPATTFWHYGLVGKNHRWTNGVKYIETSFSPDSATLHQLNVQIGAKYCPVS